MAVVVVVADTLLRVAQTTRLLGGGGGGWWCWTSLLEILLRVALVIVMLFNIKNGRRNERSLLYSYVFVSNDEVKNTKLKII
jgi:hypothetical protein